MNWLSTIYNIHIFKLLFILNPFYFFWRVLGGLVIKSVLRICRRLIVVVRKHEKQSLTIKKHSQRFYYFVDYGFF